MYGLKDANSQRINVLPSDLFLTFNFAGGLLRFLDYFLALKKQDIFAIGMRSIGDSRVRRTEQSELWSSPTRNEA